MIKTYETEEKNACCPCTEEIVEVATLGELVRETTNIMGECFTMAYRLNEYMFGIGAKNNEEVTAKCMRDELSIQNDRIKHLHGELLRLCEFTGCM